MKKRILVVEEELTISNFISTILSSNGYHPIVANSAKEAMSIITSHIPDVILLDLGLPDMDGLDILKSVRKWSAVPIIVVSARGLESDKVEALDLGADDYITKPFGTEELLARIRTALRHSMHTTDVGTAIGGIFKLGDFEIDYDKMLITVCGERVKLTQIEFKIISLLSKYAGKVLTYDFLMKSIWGPYAPKDNRILRVNMANIRRKIEENPAEPKYIFTEVGVGYRMTDEE